MLYPTHQKYGIFFGICMIPLSVFIGLLPTLSVDMRPIDIIIVLLACFMGLSGAMFGARFPDIDSPQSIPARRHPLIRKVFAFFKIKHRGKYSHDYATIGVTFLLAYMVIHFGGNTILQKVSEGHVVSNILVYAISVVLLVIIGADMVDFILWFGKKFRFKSLVAAIEKHRTLYSAALVIAAPMLLWVGGDLSITAALTGKDLTTSLILASSMVVILKIYAVFAWAGAYSHLFADMTTKEGVYFFGIKLSPARVILKVKKIPLIGKLLVPTEFLTGSKWEDFNAMVITIACIPSAMIALMVLFGFNLSWLF